MIDTQTRNQIITALQYYADQGLDACVLENAVNRLKGSPEEAQILKFANDVPCVSAGLNDQPQNVMQQARRQVSSQPQQTFLGKSEAYEGAVRLAKQAENLEDLARAISEFDGISLKKTASNMVFGIGHPQAEVMLVGEAPGADEDRVGIPFVGVSGQLLDRILNCIELDRDQNDPQKSVYISNILNWRPPGNRTPSPAEIEVSLPFIERHIQLVSPKVLVFCGGVAAKALLGREQSISRLRNCWHDYMPITQALNDKSKPIPAIATYHPSYLLRTPVQKKLVWEDMLTLQTYRQKNLQK